MIVLLRLSFLVVLLLTGKQAIANDQELYDPSLPPDAVFVRLINASAGQSSLMSSLVHGQ